MFTKEQQVGKKRRKQRKRVPLNGYAKCFFCDNPPVDIDEIFRGTANRQLSIEYGLCISVCRCCHDEKTKKPFGEKDLMARAYGKKYFDKTYPELNFVSVFNTRWE